MGVSDARALRARAYELPIVLDHVTFVLSAESVTREAQNALLKLFEDPPRTARFIMLLEKSAVLLPTLASRFLIIADTPTSAEIIAVPELREGAALLLKIKDDERYRFMLRQTFAHARTGRSVFSSALLTLEMYIDTKGASQKMLVEHALLTYHEDNMAQVAKGTRGR
jgi:hypothetical protein